MNPVTNIVFVGLGGQGVLKACEIAADAAFRLGYDVKKAEVHGMSRRGGSVACDVRFGTRVWSPMVPAGEADYLVALPAAEVESNRWRLSPAGVLIDVSMIPEGALPERRALNVALLGALSRHLTFPEDVWLDAIRGAFTEKLRAPNCAAFALGRASVR